MTHIVQISWITYDTTTEEYSASDHIIDCGVEIRESVDIHGISKNYQREKEKSCGM